MGFVKTSTPWGRNNFQATPTKEDLGTCKGSFCKYLTKHHRPFYTGVRSGTTGTEFFLLCSESLA